MNSNPSASSYLESGRPRDDRLEGRESRVLFQDFLRKKGRHPESNPGGYHPDFDVRDEHFTYEVKFDRKVQQTGNVYIEKKSIFNSKSDYLVYLFQRDVTPALFIFIAPSAKVRNYLRRHTPDDIGRGF